MEKTHSADGNTDDQVHDEIHPNHDEDDEVEGDIDVVVEHRLVIDGGDVHGLNHDGGPVLQGSHLKTQTMLPRSILDLVLV
jgi:hypothetical protein